MLFAYLGVGGDRTDVVGHIAGPAAGGGIGVALGARKSPKGRRVQWACGTAAAALFALAWALALRAHG